MRGHAVACSDECMCPPHHAIATHLLRSFCARRRLVRRLRRRSLATAGATEGATVPPSRPAQALSRRRAVAASHRCRAGPVPASSASAWRDGVATGRVQGSGGGAWPVHGLLARAATRRLSGGGHEDTRQVTRQEAAQGECKACGVRVAATCLQGSGRRGRKLEVAKSDACRAREDGLRTARRQGGGKGAARGRQVVTGGGEGRLRLHVERLWWAACSAAVLRRGSATDPPCRRVGRRYQSDRHTRRDSTDSTA